MRPFDLRSPRVTAHTARLVPFCLAVACGSPPKALPVTADVPVVPPPSATPPPSASGAAPSPPPQSAKVTAALARVPVIAGIVSEIRGLPLKHPVPAAVESQAQFRTYLDGEIKKELPPEKAAGSTKALVRLGFLKESVDLGKTIEDAMLSQAGAYYDPDTKKFYLVLVPDDETMLDVMSAHELTHAIDDQYFDLAAYGNDPKFSNDVEQARRMVGEGDATLVMLAYQAKVSAHQDIFDPSLRRMEQTMVATFASLDSEQLAKSAADNPQIVSQMDPSLKASIDAMSSIPPFILDPLFGAYTKGCAALAAVRDAGGWRAVDALYTNPPESTEQLLHPVEKLITKRDHPVTLALPPLTLHGYESALSGLTLLDDDVIGELTMAVYFKNWGDPHPAAEVTGWGGDYYAAYARGDATLAVWLTTWDTPKDAARFAKAYAASLGVRFPHDHAWTGKGGARGVLHTDGTVTAFVTTGATAEDVDVVDGVPAAQADRVLDWMHHRLATVHKGP